MKSNALLLAVLLVLAVAAIAFIAPPDKMSEYFAASAGGTLIQLRTSHVPTPGEMEEELEEEAIQVNYGLHQMTDPSGPPYPAGR